MANTEIKIETITPHIARTMLGMNTGNFRRPDNSRVARYAADIKSGNWSLTGDTIKFNGNLLLDGQHRLLAVIEANAPIITAVAYGIQDSAMHIDRGKPRTIGQWLRHLGHSDFNNIAAASKLIITHDKGYWGKRGIPTEKFSDAEMVEYAEAYKEELHDASRLGATARKFLPQSLAAAIIHISSGRTKTPASNEIIQWFWSGLASGADMVENDPPFTLRSRLLSNKLSTTHKLSVYHMRWLVTLAWNRACIGDQISPSGLRIRSTGPGKQEPPSKILTVE